MTGTLWGVSNKHCLLSFFIFALKERLFVLVNEVVLTCTHNIGFEGK